MESNTVAWVQYVADLTLGGIALSSSLLFFGLALHRGWIGDLTPRIANRPKGVLKRAIFEHLPKWMKNNPMWYPIAWIGWAYQLTYKECHKGIPGTGTRKDGTEGPLLTCNLDAIIMMRYQTLLFKVGVLVFCLCTFVILPVNVTAPCDESVFGKGTCDQRDNDSFFQITTINNIPDKIYNPTNETVNVTFQTGDIFLGLNEQNSTSNNGTSLMDFFVEVGTDAIRFLDNDYWVKDQTPRVLATVISCVLIYVYTMYLLTWEWIENVALRRKYYLEATIYSQRTAELNKMALEKDQNDSILMEGKYDCENCVESDKTLASQLRQEREKANRSRPEYLTHPEITETPPSVGIFSVLYQLPPSMVTFDTDGATALERQLVATSNFFDEIIPPELGFSSSVAAVTVLPNAKLLSRAESKWESCEKKLQQLRYTRRRLRVVKERQEEYEQKELNRQRQLLISRSETTTSHFKEESQNEQIRMNRNGDEGKNLTQTKYASKSHPNNGSNDPKIVGTRVKTDGSIESVSASEKSEPSIGEKSPLQGAKTPEVIEIASVKPPPSPLRPSTKGGSKFQAQDKSSTYSDVNTAESSENAPAFRYEDFDVLEYARSIGLREEVDNTVDFVQGMGIEEFNIFAFKCAEIAGRNPRFDQRLFNQYGIETLQELENDLLDEVREANHELLQARQDVAMFGDENELEDSELALQPAITCDDDDSIIERYGNCEVAGHLSTGIRKRRTSVISANNTSTAVTSLQDHGKMQDSDAGDGTATKPKRTMIWSLWKVLKCILLFPKRIYWGKEGTDDFRDRLKYYGMNNPSDTGRSKGFVTNLDHPSYAVVTFTTRHAAVIARQCLADGAPRNHWRQVDDIPLYPLADAPYWGIMRPVTPTISYASKRFRGYLVLIITVAFIIGNVYVLDLINSTILNPVVFSKAFAIELEKAQQWSSTAAGLTQTLLFSISPYIFEILANIEGYATSEGKAEKNALLYFWHFYIIARFMGKIVWDMWLDFWQGSTAEDSINQAITQLARTATRDLGPLAWTYIIYACTVTWPIVYFLQFPNMATSFLRLKWINRMLKSGGPGSDANYRIYADSGYIFACMTALAPLCPLLGFCCLLYFVIINPMLRWLMVFSYRPVFDGGGDKWPYLHYIIITSLLLGQLITAITLFLKQNKIEGLFIGLWIIPTLIVHGVLFEKYLRPYMDAALLQTRRMYAQTSDSFANTTNSWLEREEYRRWLVDCHKASYLPTCLSGGTENLLTAEPAVVISEGSAPVVENADGLNEETEDPWGGSNNKEPRISKMKKLLKRQKNQKGGIFRRQRFNI